MGIIRVALFTARLESVLGGHFSGDHLHGRLVLHKGA